jgi:hypothetical protein
MYHANSKKVVGSGINARKIRLMQKKKRALQKLKEGHHSAGDLQKRAQLYVSYSNLTLSDDPIFGLFPEKDNASSEAGKKTEKKKTESISPDRMTFLID